jgi:hypothetical protein
MLPVNTLNFCAFSMLAGPAATTSASALESASHYGLQDSVLVAVPARDDSKIEVYRFPDEKLIFVVPRVQHADTGKIRAFQQFHSLLVRPLILLDLQGNQYEACILAFVFFGRYLLIVLHP